MKHYRAVNSLINCGWCPYHRVENSSRHANRSWKEYRKNQYRNLKE